MIEQPYVQVCMCVQKNLKQAIGLSEIFPLGDLNSMLFYVEFSRGIYSKDVKGEERVHGIY